MGILQILFGNGEIGTSAAPIAKWNDRQPESSPTYRLTIDVGNYLGSMTVVKKNSGIALRWKSNS